MINLASTVQQISKAPGGIMIVQIQIWMDFITQKTRQSRELEFSGDDGKKTDITRWKQQQWK